MNSIKAGEQIRKLRISKGLTQEEVAEKLYVSRQAVSFWEIGKTMPSIDSCIILMDLFETDIETLLGLKQKQNRGMKLLEVFDLLSEDERHRILKSIKEGSLGISKEEILPLCSEEEKKYLEEKQ